MLNGVKIIGKVLSVEIKEREEKKESICYLSLLVSSPSGSLTILRCFAQGEIVKRIEKEIKQDEILEVKGYLRNERVGRQILIRVVEFTKLDKTFKQVDENSTNQVRLLGRINADLQVRVNEKGSKVISFHLVVLREGNELPRFFCRVQGDQLINEVSSKLKKNDIVLVEGFLQTVKIEEKERDLEYTGKISRISSIICQKFVLLGNDSVNFFNPFKQFTQIVGEVEKIDFAKPIGTEKKRE